jgi:hypothetical protein
MSACRSLPSSPASTRGLSLPSWRERLCLAAGAVDAFAAACCCRADGPAEVASGQGRHSQRSPAAAPPASFGWLQLSSGQLEALVQMPFLADEEDPAVKVRHRRARASLAGGRGGATQSIYITVSHNLAWGKEREGGLPVLIMPSIHLGQAAALRVGLAACMLSREDARAEADTLRQLLKAAAADAAAEVRAAAALATPTGLAAASRGAAGGMSQARRV